MLYYPYVKTFLKLLYNVIPSDKYQKSMYEQPPRIKNPTESNEFYDLYWNCLVSKELQFLEHKFADGLSR